MNYRQWRLSVVVTVCTAAVMMGCVSITTSAEDSEEAKLIAVLKSDADWFAKDAACRRLRVIGTAQSVPALAALLTDEKLSHIARYALEPMPFSESGKALRDALGQAQGSPKAGVAISLGARRDKEAVPLLSPLLTDANVDIARAAAGALGRIATAEAADALFDAQDTVALNIKPALYEGLLAAAQQMDKEGEHGKAAKIFDQLLNPDRAMNIRMGAFRGLAYAKPSADWIEDALEGDDPVLRDMAAQIVAETSGEKDTKYYAKELPELPVEGQVALLRGLAARKDPVARPAVAQALSNKDKNVQLAALKALGSLGNAENVPVLVEKLGSEDADIAETASQTLTALEGPEIDAALADGFKIATAPVCVKLLELLTNRRAAQTVSLAVQCVNDGDAQLRGAGLRALERSGGLEEAPGVIALLMKSSDAAERSAAESTLGAIGVRAGEPMLPSLLSAMKEAPLESRVVFLRVIAQIGGAQALETVLTSMADTNEPIRTEALNLLSTWTTADAAPHLRKLAESADLSQQVLGLRGYVRLAQNETAVDKKIAMLTDAMGLVKRPDEKKLVLSAWGALPAPQSLTALLPQLDDPAVKSEAALAVINVATQLGKQSPEGKTLGIDALKTVLGKCDDATIHDTAQNALTNLQK